VFFKINRDSPFRGIFFFGEYLNSVIEDDVFYLRKIFGGFYKKLGKIDSGY